MRALFDLIQPSRLTSIVDIGSNPVDGSPPYARMLDEGMCTVTGIDPQGEAPEHPNVKTLRYIVGDGTKQTFHACTMQGMSSLLRISKARASLFPNMLEWGTPAETRNVQTTRLDDIPGIDAMDFLKMDVQGSELDILSYSREKLSKCVAVMTEMSFVPLYAGQAAFGRMDTELRHLGFMPHCFVEAKLWPLATQSPIPNLAPNQLLECDMLYVRDITNSMSDEMWKHLAMVAHHICGSFDLAMRCISELARMEAVSPSAPEQYRQILERM